MWPGLSLSRPRHARAVRKEGVNGIGDCVRSTDGRWMVRPPERCADGHLLVLGRVLVGTAACSCGDRHLSWMCDCGAVTYGPELGARLFVVERPGPRQVSK